MGLKPRAPRIKQISLKDVKVFFESDELRAAVGKSGLANLSASGMAVFCDKLPSSVNLGDQLSAEIDFGNRSFRVVITLVRAEQNILAFMFEKIENAITGVIMSRFPFELKGQKLIKVAESSLKVDSGGQPFWYYDGRENELYFLLEDNQLQYMRISLCGKYIELYPGYPMLVRRYNPKDATKQMPGTRSVDNIIDLTETDRQNIVKFITHIQNLDQGTAQQLLSYFSATR